MIRQELLLTCLSRSSALTGFWWAGKSGTLVGFWWAGKGSCL